MNCEQDNIIVREAKSKKKFSLKNFISTIPFYTKIAIIIAAISFSIHVAASIFPVFSDFFTQYIAASVRTVAATLTGWFPFSLAETIILMLPVI